MCDLKEHISHEIAQRRKYAFDHGNIEEAFLVLWSGSTFLIHLKKKMYLKLRHYCYRSEFFKPTTKDVHLVDRMKV